MKNNLSFHYKVMELSANKRAVPEITSEALFEIINNIYLKRHEALCEGIGLRSNKRGLERSLYRSIFAYWIRYNKCPLIKSIPILRDGDIARIMGKNRTAIIFGVRLISSKKRYNDAEVNAIEGYILKELPKYIS